MLCACVWCLRIVKMPDTFNPKDKYKDTVCSDECAKYEQRFLLYFSDELIGQRNYEDQGVNPNHRGKKNGKV